jgi:hypothetical protein
MPHPNMTFSYEGLSQVLCRSVTTLRSDRVRRPESVPPACKIPGSSRPLWIYADVIEWLRACQTAPSAVTKADSQEQTDTTNAANATK